MELKETRDWKEIQRTAQLSHKDPEISKQELMRLKLTVRHGGVAPSSPHMHICPATVISLPSRAAVLSAEDGSDVRCAPVYISKQSFSVPV